MALLEIENLRIGTRRKELVKGIDLDIEPGQWYALIGESGSGKSITSRSIANLLAPNLIREADKLQFGDQDLLRISNRNVRELRGDRIAYVFQDYQAAFTHYYRIGNQFHELMRAHRPWGPKERAERMAEALDAVGLDPALERRYPFQVSGGQLQRAALAMAIALEPELLIADEPTTALDAWNAARVLEHMDSIKERLGCAILFITHDLRIMRRHADEVAIMRQGEIVERGSKQRISESPEHSYTRDLFAAIPPLRNIPDRLPVAGDVRQVAAERRDVAQGLALSVRDLRKEFPGTVAVDSVSFDLRSGTTLGLVGESGSGKSTLARCVLTLEKADSGTILLHGDPLERLQGKELRAARQRMQVVMQNPVASFNDRLTIMDSLMEPLHCQRREAPSFLPEAKSPRQVAEGLLELARLPADYLGRKPAELSGGELQRAAIARAISVEPEFIVLDEPTASLDVSTQARVLNLLKDLQDQLGLSFLFISHDLSSVQFISDYVMVMQNGCIVDQFDRDSVFDEERHEYTKQLVLTYDV